ncbi:MAG: 30S ribosome-binding factor RbfA [Candidatus Kapabacteria bacterium]|nr:30S ribosome-binding factor RbfA [Candidatus Kapabacteria bacterium]MDW7996914.1 30S ribosome-binding factor RbfA [Bacteroidota bacterium]MDW8225754.1 30S ribosome-binding factor RbfA [Bacteroidota bacterium]
MSNAIPGEVMSIKTERVGSLLQEVLSKPLRKLAEELSSKLLLTVTRVEVSGDLRYATVYVSLYGAPIAPTQVLQHLQQHHRKLREYIAEHTRLRHIPELRFRHDTSAAYAEHITELLNRIHQQNFSSPQNPYDAADHAAI